MLEYVCTPMYIITWALRIIWNYKHRAVNIGYPLVGSSRKKEERESTKKKSERKIIVFNSVLDKKEIMYYVISLIGV